MKLRKSLLNLIIVLIFLFLLISLCSYENIKSIIKTGEKQLLIDGRKYKLIWEDNFENNILDKNKWSYRGLGKRKLGYLSDESIDISNGYLKIKIFENLKKYYSGMIGTQEKFEIKFGYFEAKVKLQNEPGTQCAFWLQSLRYGEKLGDVEYSGAEIDIFEYIKKQPKILHHTVHYDGYKTSHKSIHMSSKLKNERNWHEIGLLWTEDSYKFYVDGILVDMTSEAVSHTPQFLILSCEITKWGGDINNSKLPDYFLVDYVRVYKNIK